MNETNTRPRIALCLEQTLGHRAHARNIVAVVDAYEPADVTTLPVEYRERGRFGPPWALRGSYIAARQLRAAGRFDAALFHTQTIALLSRWGSPRVPYVVSVDATPIQMDELGNWYQHRRGNSLIEQAKRRWYRSVFAGASAVVAWSEWAARSLANDYGVAGSRLQVVHPGAPRPFFELDVERSPVNRPRILFVGGDFERKGGPALVRAWEAIRDRADLDLVTGADVEGAAGLRVLKGVQPGSPELLQAYRDADIFCLPTLGDCTSVAIGEAMAAGLPVVTTRVGSNEETAPAGDVSLLVAPGDDAALARALDALVSDRALRLRLGNAGRMRAQRLMDATANATRLLDIVRAAAPAVRHGEMQWVS